MDNNSSFKVMENKVFSAYYDDGFIDFVAAIIFIQFALFTLISRLGDDNPRIYVLPALAFFILFCGAVLIRKNITEPRLGYVRFMKQRKQRVGSFFKFTIVLLASGIFFLAILPKNNLVVAVLPISIIFLLLYTAGGFALNMNRIYLYGILAAVAMPLGKAMDLLSGWKFALPLTMLIIGMIMISFAMIVFIRFIKKYPLKGVGE